MERLSELYVLVNVELIRIKKRNRFIPDKRSSGGINGNNDLNHVAQQKLINYKNKRAKDVL